MTTTHQCTDLDRDTFDDGRVRIVAWHHAVPTAVEVQLAGLTPEQVAETLSNRWVRVDSFDDVPVGARFREIQEQRREGSDPVRFWHEVHPDDAPPQYDALLVETVAKAIFGEQHISAWDDTDDETRHEWRGIAEAALRAEVNYKAAAKTVPA